jgi:hypothetical protein
MGVQNLLILYGKFDALAGRVNTFIILHTIEGTFKVRNLYEKIFKWQFLRTAQTFFVPKSVFEDAPELFSDFLRITRFRFKKGLNQQKMVRDIDFQAPGGRESLWTTGEKTVFQKTFLNRKFF